MAKYEYVCDECEDTEFWDEILKEGFHCECGGHLILLKPDHFSEVEYIENCMVCRHKGSSKCFECKHN